ncbi:MAG TPA: type I pullulanase [Phycisphaerae bacterium]|nr:type I pullulanase [Phycisphaerae bacterium]
MEQKVRSVTLDAWKHLTVRFSHRLPASDWHPDRFQLTASDGAVIPIKAVYPFKHRGDLCAVYSLEVENPFEFPQKRYVLSVDGFGEHRCRPDYILRDAARFYDDSVKLGATYAPAATEFAVFAPNATEVKVVIANQPDGTEGLTEHPLTINEKGIWQANVAGDCAGRFYAYKVSADRLDSNCEVIDPYAVCTQGRHPRSLIVDLAATDPPGFREHEFAGVESPTDAIIYEMHVRDLTIAADSGVSQKGKYLGLTEPSTHLASDPATSTALAHIKEMGVNCVQIMPVQDFDNDETDSDAYNWGYMPLHFNSPDGWYASETVGPSRITELKSAIHAFHENGIGVILDVVYNHTAAWASFEKLIPGYYFRMTPAGNFSNGSGCGNEFDSEMPMARKFLLDSLRYWVREYRVDGFRFDLMALIDFETMKQIRDELTKINPRILIYGEPWVAAATPLKNKTEKQVTRGSGIGAFNDRFRDAIKGQGDGGDAGFMQYGRNVDGIVKGLMGAVHDWAQDPIDTINYFEAHDNLTAWDKLLLTAPDASDEDRSRMMRLALVILLTAQGVVFLHSGQEMCRTKGGNHNSYNAPDDVNEVDWSRKPAFAGVCDYARGLIALRKAHPLFRLRTRDEVERRVHFAVPPRFDCIVYQIDGDELADESVKSMWVLLNGSGEDVEFTLADGRWGVLADGTRSGVEVLETVEKVVRLPGRSGMVLAGGL